METLLAALELLFIMGIISVVVLGIVYFLTLL